MKNQVVIIGGGWAGLTAAVELAGHGVNVTVVDRGRIPGGRARSFCIKSKNWIVDWGQHLFLGCYVEMMKLLRLLGTDKHISPVKEPVSVFGVSPVGETKISTMSVPFPLNFLLPFFSYSHISLKDRLKMGRVVLEVFKPFKKRMKDDSITAMRWLQQLGQTDDLLKMVWEPLIVSALNEKPEKVSAFLFEEVLKRGFFAGGDYSVPYLSNIPLGELVALPAVRFIESRGGSFLGASRVVSFQMSKGRIRRILLQNGKTIEGDIFISAVPPHELVPLLDSIECEEAFNLKKKISVFRNSPIVTVFVKTDKEIISSPYAALLEEKFHWIFRRCGWNTNGTIGCKNSNFEFAFVKSAAYDMVNCTRTDLLKDVNETIQKNFHKLKGFKIIDAAVIREINATVSFFPSSNEYRPQPGSLASRGLLIAGDWIATGLPATCESAVSSGFMSARLCLQM